MRRVAFINVIDDVSTFIIQEKQSCDYTVYAKQIMRLYNEQVMRELASERASLKCMLQALERCEPFVRYVQDTLPVVSTARDALFEVYVEDGLKKGVRFYELKQTMQDALSAVVQERADDFDEFLTRCCNTIINTTFDDKNWPYHGEDVPIYIGAYIDFHRFVHTEELHDYVERLLAFLRREIAGINVFVG